MLANHVVFYATWCWLPLEVIKTVIMIICWLPAWVSTRIVLAILRLKPSRFFKNHHYHFRVVSWPQHIFIWSWFVLFEPIFWNVRILSECILPCLDESLLLLGRRLKRIGQFSWWKISRLFNFFLYRFIFIFCIVITILIVFVFSWVRYVACFRRVRFSSFLSESQFGKLFFFFRFEFRFVFIILDTCIVSLPGFIVSSSPNLHLVELAINSFFVDEMFWEVRKVIVKPHVLQMTISLIILALNFLNDIFHAILKLGFTVFKFINDLVWYRWVLFWSNGLFWVKNLLGILVSCVEVLLLLVIA